MIDVWSKPMFVWKRMPDNIRDEVLRQLIAERNEKYLRDFVADREVEVDLSHKMDNA